MRFNHIYHSMLTALLASIILSISACGQADRDHDNALGEIRQTGVLKVGTVYGLSTFYHDANGTAGFEYELARGFAEHLGVLLEIYPYYNLTELQQQVDDGYVDIAAAGVPINPSQFKTYDLGPVYHEVSQKLVYKQGRKRPRKWQDVNHPLILVSGANHTETLRQLKPQYPHLTWQETKQMGEEEILVAIKRGEVDYTLTDSDTLALVRRRHPEISVAFTVNDVSDVAWLLPNAIDDSLQSQLFEYFAKINSDGTLKQLKERYFGHIQIFNYVDTKAFIKAADGKLPSFLEWFKQYSLDLDWRLIAALSYQESHWDPKATSPTGVRGLMMLTQATAKDWGVKSRLDPKQNIVAGTKYLSSLMRRLPKRIEHPDRLWFALAAYNIGMGHLEDARIITQRQGGNPDLWIDVKQRLPLLRKKAFYKNTKYGYARGDEATVYVANIRRYYDTLTYLYPNKREGKDTKNLGNTPASSAIVLPTPAGQESQ